MYVFVLIVLMVLMVIRVIMDFISINNTIQLTSPPLRIGQLNLVSPHGLGDVTSCLHGLHSLQGQLD